jgi:hypothetical protein
VAQVWGRVWYISHEGELVLEREDGTTLESRSEMERLVEQWSVHFTEHPRGRDTVQLSFSVPESEVRGSPEARERVREAVRASARVEWSSTHPYVMAAHTDSGNYHVHVLVRNRGEEGQILATRKADLERWRVRFAAACRERGLWVDASPRLARGQTPRGVPTSVHRKLERGESLRSESVPSAAEAAPWESALRKQNAEQRRGYVEQARAAVVEASGESEAPKREELLRLAVELGQYAVELPFERPRSEQVRGPVQRLARVEGRGAVISAVASLGGEGGVATSSDARGWLLPEEAGARSGEWHGEGAAQLRFVVGTREFASAQEQGRAVVGIATAALRRVGVRGEYALRADVVGDQVRVHAVVSDPEDRLGRSIDRLEERFAELAVKHGYGVERPEPRPGLAALEGELRALEREVREAARELSEAERHEVSSALRSTLRAAFDRSEEPELEL